MDGLRNLQILEIINAGELINIGVFVGVLVCVFLWDRERHYRVCMLYPELFRSRTRAAY